jgi:uncharacterized protein YdeI (BOF family)
MKRVLIAAALAAVSIPAAAQTETQTQSPNAGAAGSSSPSRSTPIALSEMEIVGEVVKVNKGAKTIVVKDPAGKKMKVSVPAEVSSLDNIKPGNLLDMRYLQAVALSVGKPGQGGQSAEQDVRLAPQGGSEMTVKSKKMTGTVTEFDRSRQELTVRGTEGPVTFHAPEGFVNFDAVKVGDTVALQYTEAVAITAGKREAEGASGDRGFDRTSTPITPADRTDTDTRRPGSDPGYQQRNDPTRSPDMTTPPNQQPSQTPNTPR